MTIEEQIKKLKWAYIDDTLPNQEQLKGGKV